MFELATGAIKGAILVYDQAITAKSNTEEIAALGKRLGNLATLLEAAQKNPDFLNNPNLKKMIVSCAEHGDACKTELKSYAEKSTAKLFFKAQTYKDMFTALNKKLDQNIADFTASVTVDNNEKLSHIQKDAVQKQKFMEDQHLQQNRVAATNFANQQTLAQMQQAAHQQQQYAAAQLLQQQQQILNQLAALQPKPVAAAASSSSSSTVTVTTRSYEGMSHMQDVSASCSLSNGLVVSGSEDSTVKLWDPSEGYAVDILRYHDDEVTGVAEIYKNGIPTGYAVSVSRDEKIKIWPMDIPAGKKIRSVKTLRGHQGPVLCVADFGNGKIATGSTDKTVRIWDIDADEEEAQIIKLKGHTEKVVSLVAMSEDMLVSASGDSTVKVWSIDWKDNTAELLYTLEMNTLRMMSVCKVSSSVFATADVEANIKLWSLKSGTELASYKEECIGLYSLASMGSGSNRLIFGDTKGRVNLLEVSENTNKKVEIKKIKVMIHAYEKTVFTVARGPSANTILSGSKDLKLKLFDIEKCAELLTFTGIKGEVLAKNNAASSVQSLYTPVKNVGTTSNRTSPPPSTNTNEHGSPGNKSKLSTSLN